MLNERDFASQNRRKTSTRKGMVIFMTASSRALEVYDLLLTVVTPFFVGDGIELDKRSYLYNQSKKTVSMIDPERLFKLIVDNRLTDAYEAFMLGGGKDLYEFLRQNRVSEQAINELILFSVDAENAIVEDKYGNPKLQNIRTFIRDAYGNPYVPGSSVKGALRTIILQKLILDDKGHPDMDTKSKYFAGDFDKAISNRYINTLKLHKVATNPLNSIMRGIRISDSRPLSNSDLTLSKKTDVHTDGFNKDIPVVRETLKPQSEIQLKLTLDQGLLKNQITPDYIINAVNQYADYYSRTYAKKFSQPDNSANIDYTGCLIFGGGAGFFSKSLLYPYFGKERAVEITSELMERKYSGHKCDIEQGISPRTLKYTKFRQKLLPLGVCKIEIK